MSQQESASKSPLHTGAVRVRFQLHTLLFDAV